MPTPQAGPIRIPHQRASTASTGGTNRTVAIKSAFVTGPKGNSMMTYTGLVAAAPATSIAHPRGKPPGRDRNRRGRGHCLPTRPRVGNLASTRLRNDLGSLLGDTKVSEPQSRHRAAMRNLEAEWSHDALASMNEGEFLGRSMTGRSRHDEPCRHLPTSKVHIRRMEILRVQSSNEPTADLLNTT